MLVRRLILAALILAAAVSVILVLPPILATGKDLISGPISVASVIANRGQQLKSDNGRTNILLLGIGDAGHDGPNLTDSMMVISFESDLSVLNRSATPSVVLISIPRDIYLDSLGGKINSAYAVGQEQSPPAGLVLAKGVASGVTGLPIQYAIRADFSVFRKAIDMLGGVDVKVANGFDDYQYPIDGREDDNCGLTDGEINSRLATMSAEVVFPCRYEHLHFDPGWQHMDGATALKFVRSRHATGEEGTDFARAGRQQLIMAAVRDKIFSIDNLLNPSRLVDVYNQFKKGVDTDINPSEYGAFLNVAMHFRTAKIDSAVLDMKFFDNPPVDSRGWILLPKGGGWDEVHQFVRETIASSSAGLK